MPKVSTYPILLDSVKQISISDFKIEPGKVRAGVLRFLRSGEEVGSIGYTTYLNDIYPYLNLSYNVNGESVNYNISIEEKPSNLGFGSVYYFMCPLTHKPCRKLYLVGSKFLHRTAYKGCCYDSQIESKHYRELKYTFGSLFEKDKAYEQIYSKYFKRYYKEKPTKRYLKLLRIIEAGDQVNSRSFYSLFSKFTN